MNEIPISSIAMKPVVTVRPEDTPQGAESSMQRHQVRRLAVVDGSGRLVGMLSLNDFSRAALGDTRHLSNDEIARTLAAICQPRGATRPVATA